MSRGVLRFMRTEEESVGWRDLIGGAFPSFNHHRLTTFAFDWRGCAFALNHSHERDGVPRVMIFDVDEGVALTVPGTLSEVFEVLVFEEPDQLLTLPVFEQWATANPHALPIAHDSCVGTTVPSFLGGEVEPENLEVVPVRFYWEITGALLVASSELGESLAGVTIEDP